MAVFVDPQVDPASGDGIFYLIRARDPCGVADMGEGRGSLETLDCAGP